MYTDLIVYFYDRTMSSYYERLLDLGVICKHISLL